MELLDTTLREGEQRYGVFFATQVKAELAAHLVNIADLIEIGSPQVAPSYAEAAKQLAAIIPAQKLLVHCTLNEDCIRSAKELGAQWVGLFVAIREDLHRVRYGRPIQRTRSLIKDLLILCQELDLHVRITCEDASRTGIDELVRFYSDCIAAGADRIGFADTVGILTPDQTHNYLCGLKHANLPLSKVHVHFHNDRGFANDNAEVAIKLDVGCIDGTVNGIGERMGITSTEHLTTLLGKKVSPFIDEARSLVAAHATFHPDSELRFAHKAGIHINGVLKYPSTYEYVAPESLRLNRSFVLSKLSGRSAVRYYLNQLPRSTRPTTELVDAILTAIKHEDSLEVASLEQFEKFLLAKSINIHLANN